MQHKLNIDLKNVACWLEENILTLNTTKSKFMLIVNSKKELKNICHLKLTVNNRTLERESKLKNLGIVINENLSWADHFDFVSKTC